MDGNGNNPNGTCCSSTFIPILSADDPDNISTTATNLRQTRSHSCPEVCHSHFILFFSYMVSKYSNTLSYRILPLYIPNCYLFDVISSFKFLNNNNN